MKEFFSLLLAALCVLASAMTLRAQSSAFTYQGRLTTSNAPAQGTFDLRFAIYDVANGGSPASSRITHSTVGVTNGLFAVPLDFGSDPFTGGNRWLDIEVRPAGGTTFTPLTPRQLLTATPYAVTALSALTAKQVPGVSGNALHAQDGSPQNAVFVNNAGNVGIGTTNPQEKLDLRSGDGSYVRVDIANGDIKANGGSDGHFGIFNEGPLAGGTHLIGGGLTRVFIGNNGNVGIGTTTPAAKLDVQGEVRIGPDGKLVAAGGVEGLGMLRGIIHANGDVAIGSGFTCTQLGTGHYLIRFTEGFRDLPVVTANVAADGNDATPLVAMWANNTLGTVEFIVRRGSDGTRVSRAFSFTAIGRPN